MSDFDKFNPDVPQVDPGNYTDVTRPISRPEANTAKGTLFSALGTGLKDTGELVKDSTKLQDFTNKEWLSNSISLEANAARDVNTVKLEETNQALQGQPAPSGLSSVQPKVDKLKAAADQGEQDVYFRGRVNELAKQYRASYPQYRDYIDQVFQKAGFGNPANEYMTTLERANQKIQSALAEGKSKTLDLLYKDGDKINNAAGLIDDLKSGKKTESEVNAIVFPQLKTHADVAARQAQFTLEAADSKNREPQAARLVTDNITDRVGTYMSHDPEFLAIQKQMEAGTIDEPTAEHYAMQLQIAYGKMRQQVDKDNSQEHYFMTRDANGNPVQTQERYRNNSVLGADYVTTVDKAFGPLTTVINRLQDKNSGYASATARVVQAFQDENSKRAFSGSTGPQLAALSFLDKNAPQFIKEYAAAVANQNKSLVGNLGNLATSMMWPVFAPNPPAATDVLKDSQRASRNNPAVNNAIINSAPQVITNPKTPKEVKANTVQSFFGSTNPSILDTMKTEDRAVRFGSMTSPAMVRNIAELPKEGKDQYFSWVTTEVKNNIGKELNSLPDIATKYTMHWNDKTHQFGVDYPDLPQFQRQTQPTHYLGLTPIEPIVKRINTYLDGLTNLAKESGLDVNAYVVNTLQQAGLTNNKFWDAVKAQEGSRLPKVAPLT